MTGLVPPPFESPEPQSASYSKQTRSFLRAFAAANYLLGRRGGDLGANIDLGDPAAREMLDEIVTQLSHAVLATRARALAAEVGRLMRSLSAQRLK